MRLLLVGYNTGVLTALSTSPEEHQVWVLEEPDLWTAKGLAAKAAAQPCVRGVLLGEYQQSAGYRTLLGTLPEVDAVVPGLEYAVPAAADLAEHLGLPGAGTPAARTLRDKLRLRRVTSGAGMPAPAFRRVTRADEVVDFLRGGDAVLKPAQRQASLGVVLLSPGDDVPAAWAATTTADEGVQVAGRAMDWDYLVERRLRGPEYSTEALVADGVVRFVNVTRKECHAGPAPVEVAHSVPHHVDDPRWRAAVEALAGAVGFGTGILHAEWIDTDGGLVLVECAGRPPGDLIVDLVDRAWGFSLTDAWVRLLAGGDPDLPARPVAGAAIRYLVATPGVVTAVTGAEDARAAPGVWRTDVTVAPGAAVGPLRSSWDRAGLVATTGADAADAAALAARAAALVTLTVEPEDPPVTSDTTTRTAGRDVEGARPVVLFLNTRRTALEYGPAFDAADALGLDVVLLTDTPAAGARRERSREVHVVDTYDVDAVLAVARDVAARHRVVGVTTWSDRDVVTVAVVADALGLPGPSVDAARRARNKGAMRRALAHRPDLVPAFRVVTTAEDLEAAQAEIGFPAVLKPTTGSGSKGIFLLDGPADVAAAWQFLSAYTTSGADRVFEQAPGELVYERRLHGTEHSVEGYVSRGVVHVAGITDKSTTPDYRLEVAHEFPTALPERAVAAVERLTRDVVAELGLDACAFHLECFVEPDGDARLVEVAARIGGDYITACLVPAATGRDFYADVLRVVTGQEPEPGTGEVTQAAQVAQVRKVLAASEGVLAGIDGWSGLADAPSVTAVCQERAAGDAVRLPPADVMSCVVGTVIGARPLGEREALRADLDAAVAGLVVQVAGV